MHERYKTGTYMVRLAARQRELRDFREKSAAESARMLQKREKASVKAWELAERELRTLAPRPAKAAALYFLEEPQQGLPVISATF